MSSLMLASLSYTPTPNLGAASTVSRASVSMETVADLKDLAKQVRPLSSQHTTLSACERRSWPMA